MKALSWALVLLFALFLWQIPDRPLASLPEPEPTPGAASGEALRLRSAPRHVHPTGTADSLRETPSTHPLDHAAELEVTLQGFDPRDHLALHLEDGQGRNLGSWDTAAPRMLLEELPAGSARLALTYRGSKGRDVLDEVELELEPGERREALLRWPAPLSGPRRGTLAGTLEVPFAVDELGALDSLRLTLRARGDTEAQRRSGRALRELSVRKMTVLEGAELAYGWEMEALELGTWDLVVNPLGYEREVLVSSDLERIELRVMPLALTLVSAEDARDGMTIDLAGLSAHRNRLGAMAPSVHVAPRREPGLFELLSVPGELRLRMNSPEYGMQTHVIDVAAGWNDARVRLEPLLSVRVRFERERGLAPLPGRRLQDLEVTPPRGAEVVSRGFGGELTSTGFEFSHVDLQVSAPGRYLLHFPHVEGEASLEDVELDVSHEGAEALVRLVREPERNPGST